MTHKHPCYISTCSGNNSDYGKDMWYMQHDKRWYISRLNWCKEYTRSRDYRCGHSLCCSLWGANTYRRRMQISWKWKFFCNWIKHSKARSYTETESFSWERLRLSESTSVPVGNKHVLCKYMVVEVEASIGLKGAYLDQPIEKAKMDDHRCFRKLLGKRRLCKMGACSRVQHHVGGRTNKSAITSKQVLGSTCWHRPVVFGTEDTAKRC